MSTIQSTHLPQAGANGVPVIPPLQQGDHLTREEFHRRYEAMPPGIMAELIEGVVHMPSPVNFKQHGQPQFRMIHWMSCYCMLTPGVEGGDNSTLKLDMKNEPQPDACLIVPPKLGGQVQFDDKGYVVGAPEAIGEVAASSVSYDLHSKLEAYRRNRVQEYVVWRVLDNAIDWFALEGDQFVRLPCEDGIYRSRVFPGLWLDVQALMSGNQLRVFDVVQQSAATAEHHPFVAELEARKS